MAGDFFLMIRRPPRSTRKMAEHKTYREAIQRLSVAPNAKTQRARILCLLIDARGGWVPLPNIMACAAQGNLVAVCLDRDAVGVHLRAAFECGLYRTLYDHLADLRLDLEKTVRRRRCFDSLPAALRASGAGTAPHPDVPGTLIHLGGFEILGQGHSRKRI